jgi:hypothetical protein
VISEGAWPAVAAPSGSGGIERAYDRRVTDDVPAPRADRVHATAFRDLLRRADYTRDGIQAALGGSGDVLVRPPERPVNLRRIAERGTPALQSLIRLFLLDSPVDPDEAARAFAPTTLEALEALGVVEQSDGGIHGLVRVIPHGDIVVASDLPTADAQADHVAGLHRPSITLADLTVRRPVARALDVGTGCAIQALLAARHAEHVVATDINERALAFGALNAAVNGAENIEFRAGSFFEPVAGEQFGLVVCNPPYVISPETEYLFRDSGLGRDRVSERLVGELPGFLEEGGFGTIMVSWIHQGDDPAARPRSWLEGSGCDSWILHTKLEDPLTAAAGWNRDLVSDEASYAAAIDRWLEYFRAEDIGAVAYGAIVVRRRTSASRNWIRSRELPNGPRPEPAEHLARLFAGPDLVESLNDDALAAQHLALAPGASITTRIGREPDGWAEATELGLERGIPLTAELDRFTAELLAQLDGSRPLGAVLDEFAEQHDAAPARVRASGLAIARTMLELGFAAPSDRENGDRSA